MYWEKNENFDRLKKLRNLESSVICYVPFRMKNIHEDIKVHLDLNEYALSDD